MRKLLIVSGLVACMARASAGEPLSHPQGISSDTHVLLTLSEKQLQEVEKTRTFSLSKEQLADLRATHPGFPKKVGVASPFVRLIPNSRFSLWPDQVNGIWCCRNEVAIPKSCLEGDAGCRGFNNSLGPDDAVLIDTSGSCWIGSKRVDEGKLIKSFDALATRQPGGVTFNVFVLRPPRLGGTEEDVIQHAVAQVKELCDERGFACRLGG